MKKYFFFLLLFPLALEAQINESDTLKLKANLALTGFFQGGNIETIIFRARSEFGYQPFRKWDFKTTNSYVYQEFGREKADEDFNSLNFLYFNPERRFYPQLIGILATNFRRKIELRSKFGFGVTYQIIRKQDNWLKVSLSSEYEHAEFSTEAFNIKQYNGKSFINTVRGTIWLNGRYELFDKKLILNHVSFIQPSLEDADNYRWETDLGMEIPLAKYFNFKINYLHSLESIVAEGQEVEDQVLSFGFTIKTY